MAAAAVSVAQKIFCDLLDEFPKTVVRDGWGNIDVRVAGSSVEITLPGSRRVEFRTAAAPHWWCDPQYWLSALDGELLDSHRESNTVVVSDSYRYGMGLVRAQTARTRRLYRNKNGRLTRRRVFEPHEDYRAEDGPGYMVTLGGCRDPRLRGRPESGSAHIDFVEPGDITVEVWCCYGEWPPTRVRCRLPLPLLAWAFLRCLGWSRIISASLACRDCGFSFRVCWPANTHPCDSPLPACPRLHRRPHPLWEALALRAESGEGIAVAELSSDSSQIPALHWRGAEDASLHVFVKGAWAFCGNGLSPWDPALLRCAPLSSRISPPPRGDFFDRRGWNCPVPPQVQL